MTGNLIMLRKVGRKDIIYSYEESSEKKITNVNWNTKTFIT